MPATKKGSCSKAGKDLADSKKTPDWARNRSPKVKKAAKKLASKSCK